MKTLTEILNAWGVVGTEKIKQDLTKVQATGKTVDSVRYVVEKSGTVDRLTFYAREWTKLLESGRGPTTKNPSPEMIESLTEYARARGMENPKSAAWAIAKKINKEGDKTKKQGGRIVYSGTVEKLAADIKKDVTKHYTTKFMQTIKGSFAALLILLSSCGSVQTINGVRIRHKESVTAKDIAPYVVSFGMGFFIVDNYTTWRYRY